MRDGEKEQQKSVVEFHSLSFQIDIKEVENCRILLKVNNNTNSYYCPEAVSPLRSHRSIYKYRDYSAIDFKLRI